MQKLLIGNKDIFALEYAFIDSAQVTELSLFLGGDNILAYTRNGMQLTTRWNLDELTLWLKNFIGNLKEEAYPVDCGGSFAAEIDNKARDFDTDDDDAFEAYYDAIYKWNLRHRWHTASSGAILADVFFRLVGEFVEISWDNRSVEDVQFNCERGGYCVPKETFVMVVTAFLDDYEKHWH